jgi:hypothetical protein
MNNEENELMNDLLPKTMLCAYDVSSVPVSFVKIQSFQSKEYEISPNVQVILKSICSEETL